ncbi:MAG: hypothetical protein WA154_02590 [Moraxellaceae bacterium]
MKHITTHDHAPASFEQIEQLAMDRAESDAFEVAQTFASCRRKSQQLTDAQKIADQLVACQKQAELNRAAAAMEKSNLEYMLHKAEAERTAAVLLLVMFVAVTLGVLV